jgi:LysM repeat protein
LFRPVYPPVAAFVIVAASIALNLSIYKTASGVFAQAQMDPQALVAAPVLDETRAAEVQYYVVQDGDTISSIAAKFDLKLSTIAWANSISLDSLITPGQELVILPEDGVLHTVKKGESLSVIAERYDVSSETILAANKLADASLVGIGDEILVPDGKPNNYLWAMGGPTNDDNSEEPQNLPPKPEPKTETKEAPAISTGFINPVHGSVVTQTSHGKNGVDLGAPQGTTARAAASGKVIKVVNGYNGGYGNTVVIAHADGTQTLYAHLSSVVVSVNQPVSQGEAIGYVGSTGRSTGPHLHFEVRGASNPFASCGLLTRCGS